MPDPKTDRFQGDWSPQSFSGSLEHRPDPDRRLTRSSWTATSTGRSSGTTPGRTSRAPMPALSLHSRDGRLFGMFRDRQETYQTLAAFRDPADLTGSSPVCGQDSAIFGQMVGLAFLLRTMRVNGIGRARRGGRPGRHRALARTAASTASARSPDGVFQEFDQLCPDAENGNLDSRTFQGKGSTRSVSMWEMPGADAAALLDGGGRARTPSSEPATRPAPARPIRPSWPADWASCPSSSQALLRSRRARLREAWRPADGLGRRRRRRIPPGSAPRPGDTEGWSRRGRLHHRPA